MDNPTILHITNDYSGSTVYMNLVSELDKLGLQQIVYNPIREKNRIGKNKIDLEVSGSKILYSLILNKFTDRILYRKKIHKIIKDIEEKVDLTKVTCIHAHTWYSDGGVAYLISKKYNIPYIIAIRSTDLNVHYKYLLHHRKFGRQILENANKTVLIGEYQKDYFKHQIKVSNRVKEKMDVIPNGVAPFWIVNSKHFHPTINVDKFKILYVGTFIKRKKLLELQRAIIELSSQNNIKCELHIVGGGGNQTEPILNNIKTYSSLFKYHGRIERKEDLIKIYRDCHFFVMPSKHETFGLVYVEAMLQGLPILYTANEGIDGFYKEKIGEKVLSSEVEEIKQKLLMLIENYDSYTIPTKKLIDNHDWKNIALTYKKIYQ